MKQWICFILIFLLSFSLFGCKSEETVQFFYPRTNIQYGVSDGVIAAENREIENANYDLEYLLKLYLEGPVSQGLRNPFPRSTALRELKWEDNTIVISLSAAFTALDDLDYIVASSCVANTCFGFVSSQKFTRSKWWVDLWISREPEFSRMECQRRK